MKEYIEGGAKVVFGVRRKSECVCGDGSCVQNECEFQSRDFQQEVIHANTHQTTVHGTHYAVTAAYANRAGGGPCRAVGAHNRRATGVGTVTWRRNGLKDCEGMY